MERRNRGPSESPTYNLQKEISEYRRKKILATYHNLTVKQIFEKIYNDGAWGYSNNASDRFVSGSGSRDEQIVNAYADALQSFFNQFEVKLNAVDLGCGDFRVGSRIRPIFNSYIACDIVNDLIEHNKIMFRDIDVDFKVLNIIDDVLPRADVAIIRQVFQHLSNEQIIKSIAKLNINYRYLIVTEHIPYTENFVHNVDKHPGPDIRSNSGVVLTSEPFNLKARETVLLCEVPHYSGRLSTVLYKL